MDDYKIALGALLDANAKGDIDKQLNAIKDLSVTISKATLSNDVINDIKRQLTQNGIDLKLVFGNVSQITNQAKQTGQQIGQQIQSGINSAIQKGNLQKDFFFSADKKNGVAKQAQEYFRGISNGVVTVTEQMENLDDKSELRGFIVNIKNAKGEIESLKYSLRNILDDNGNVTGQKFAYTGGSINDTGSIKQIQAIENAFADYTAKLAQFKSTNTNILSGLSTPLQDFETKLAGLKNGTATIDEVKNTFKLLGTEASKITENFTGQLSKTDAAIRKLAQGDEIMDKLKASFKGLNNTPKEITKELNDVSKLLQNVKNIESKEGRTANWSAEYRKWSDEVDKLTAKLSVLQKQQANMTTPQIFKTSELKNADIPYMTKVSNTVEKQMVEIQKIANAKGWQKFEVKGIEEADGKIKALTLTVRDAEGALKQFTMQRAKLQGSGRAQTGLMQVGDVKILETASQAQDKLAQSTEKANAKLTEQVNKIQHLLDVGDYDAQIETIKKGFVSLSGDADEAETHVKGLRDALQSMHDATDDNGRLNAEKSYRLELEKTDNQLTIAKAKAKEYVDALKVSKLRNDIQDWLRKNTAATNEAKTAMTAYLNTLDDVGRVSQSSFNEAKQALDNWDTKMRVAGKLGKSLSETFKEGMKSFTSWAISSGSVMEVWNGLKNGLKTIKDLDTALVDLRKTTDATAQELEDFYFSSNETAKQLGVTTSEVINATSAWSRLGYAIEDATTLAKNSAILASISPEMDIDTATDGLVSTLKAFKIEAEDSLDGVISKINIIGNTQAVDNNDVVDILTRSSSAMAEANNTLEETIALGVAATEITRDADAVGNMLKTVSMRIRGYDEELESYTDDLANLSGTIADLTKTASSPQGISLFTDESKTTYKSTYQILKDISEIYDELDDKTQAQLLEALAGKRQGQAVAAIINNFENAEKSMNSMANSAGNAMQEMEVIYDSMDYKLNQTQETATGIAQNLFGREDMKLVIDVFNEFIGLLDKATDKLGLFGTLGLGAGIFEFIRNFDWLWNKSYLKIA